MALSKIPFIQMEYEYTLDVCFAGDIHKTKRYLTFRPPTMISTHGSLAPSEVARCDATSSS